MGNGKAADKILGAFRYEWRIPKSETVAFLYVGIGIMILSPACLLAPLATELRIVAAGFALCFGGFIAFMGYKNMQRSKQVLQIYERGFTREFAGADEGRFLYKDLQEIRLGNKLRNTTRVLRLRLTYPDGKIFWLHHHGTPGVLKERIDAILYITQQAQRAGKEIKKDRLA